MSHPQSPKNGLQKRKTMTQEKKIAEDEFMAAAIGDVEWLRQSLRGQKGVVNFDRNGLAPIHLAAIHGRVECLRLLVEKFKVDVNTPSATGWRPVHLCISNQTGKRAYQSLQYLLDKGADPSVANDDGITPMHQAASEGHVQCLKALIESGGKVWEKDDRGHTPIDLAKLWGHRKCARILATENWHQSKQFLSKEMNQLQKIKMQQVLDDIENEETHKQDQAFFGDQAFNEWLTNRGINKHDPSKHESNVKPPPVQKPPPRKSTSPSESTYKANSMRKPRGPRGPSPITEEPSMTARRNTFVSPSNEGYGSSMSQREEADKVATDGTTQPTPVQEQSSLWYNPNDWNKSTKVPPIEYTSNLPDHYPHDEYTMKPKHPPLRLAKHPSYAPKGGRQDKDSQLRMPNLPADVIEKNLHPEKYERPVVYKCKHIEDVHKKERYPMDVLPRQEIGLHLMDDMGSFLVKRGLQPEKKPTNQLIFQPPSAAATFASMLDKARITHQSSRESQQMAEIMGRMSKPTRYPKINGEEYQVPNTAAC